MSERDGYSHGVPCWVDLLQDDPDAAAAFYAELFGWDVEERTPGSAAERYLVCRLRGRDVAAVGSPPADGVPAGWSTHVWVERLDDAIARATEAGGAIVTAPSAAFDGGRTAVLADPAGAVLRAWEPGGHRGAGLVNEPSAWSMSALRTPDPEAATAFYREVFGWEPESFGPATMCRLPGYFGGEPTQPVPRDVVAVMLPAGDVAPHWGVDFWVHDADATAARAAELGGAVPVPPYDAPPFRQAVVADPQGAVLSVSQLTAGS
jgi:uncharacterized protein